MLGFIASLLGPVLSLFKINGRSVAKDIQNALEDQDTAQTRIQLATLQQQVLSQQISLNNVEATNPVAQRDWRSFVGYCCAICILFTYVLEPSIVMVADMFDKTINIPDTNGYDLIAILGGMLGIIPYDKIINIFSKE